MATAVHPNNHTPTDAAGDGIPPASSTTDRGQAKTVGSARFWDRIAKRYARSPVADEATYQKKLQITRELLRPDMDVLEFGCGTGSTALVHAPFVRHLLAIDISSKMIEIAQAKMEENCVTNVSFRQSGIEEFAAPENTFDVVLGLSILHLLKDRKQAIAKVHRLLKPDGFFISSTACLGDTQGYFKPIVSIGWFLGLLPLVRIFTRQELHDDLVEAGFVIENQWQPGKGKSVFVVARKAT